MRCPILKRCHAQAWSIMTSHIRSKFTFGVERIVVLGCSLLELIQIHVSKVAVRIIKISIFLLIFMASSYFAGAIIILIPNRKVFIILLIHVVSYRGYAYNLKTIRIKIDFQTFLIRKRSFNNTVITYTHLNFLSIKFVSYHKMYAFFCINVFCL